ncbi:MAG: outer membrane lipoprotein-sorting protein [Woeseiaceae bacterium]|nr:outer membrane lipoprotein-sorting protein [Woeseiaceae bacterium]
MVNKHTDRDDDRWLYLPGLDLVKRISAGDKRTSFVGAHYYYEDVSGRRPTDDAHEVQEVNDEYYVLRHEPLDPQSVEFASYTTWIDRETYLPMKIEYSDTAGNVYRRIEVFETDVIDGIPTVTVSRVTDVQSGGQTDMQFRHIAYDVGIFLRTFSRSDPSETRRANGSSRPQGNGVKYFLPLLLMPLLTHGQDDIWDDEAWETEEEASNWSGFIETGLGTRFDEDSLLSTRNTLQELRWRVETEWQPGKATIGFKGDAGYDGIEDTIFGDIRELTVAFTVGGSTDVKIGRQVQTWGTGDLVFLNDLFPKDFVSFFAGRDNEYLKAPGDAVRLTHYSEAANVDLAWTPVFEPDVYLTGERFSFFSPVAGGNVAPKPPFSAVTPRESLGNGEFAVRIFRNIEGREYALYAYRGYFKQPSALTEALVPTFAPMSAIGASLRRQFGPGLFNVETSWYMSRDDSDGSNPRIPNDQFRFLSGYEWEPWPNFNVGLQYVPGINARSR